MTTIQVRRGTAAQWASAATVLASGELGLDTTNNILKLGDGSTAWASLNPVLNNTYGTFSLTRFGRVGAFVGDSITAGTGSTGATTTAFVAMVPKIAGMNLVSSQSTNAGVAGNKSSDVLARMSTVLAASPDFVYLQIGTNDASNAVSLATFQTNIIAIKALCDAAGVPLVMGTVPPRASSAGTTIRDAIRSYNLWLRLWASRAGVRLAETFAALVDGTTGYLSASFDSDATHPNDAGHLAMAVAVSAALTAAVPAQAWPVSTKGTGLISDPLMAANPGGFSAGTNSAISLVAASAGDVPYGQWKRATTTNGTGSVVFQGVMNYAITTGFTTGDVLMLAAYVRASTVTALNKVQIQNQSLTVRNILLQSPPSATPGPILRTFTVLAGDTTLYVNLIGAVPASSSMTFDIGAFDVFNLTTLGLASTTV